MEAYYLTVKAWVLDISWVSSAVIFWSVIGASIVFGLLIGFVIKQRKTKRLQQHNQQLQAKLEAIQELKHDELLDVLHHNTQETLSQHTDAFLKLAGENFSKHQQQANHIFDQKQQSVATLLNPIQEALQRTNEQVKHIETTRKVDYGAITEHLKHVTQAQQAVETETRQLVTALRRPEIRGAWGELTLKRLLELSGMSAHADFSEQVSVQGEQQRLRPDVVVHLPEQRSIIIDAKTPLDAYLDAIKANTPEEVSTHFQRHSQNVKAHIKQLASKKYWQQFANSPDFVILFVPNDNFLDAALEHDQSLLEKAISQQILLATPTSLVALLRTVAHGWQQFTLSANAKELQALGTTLHDRLRTFSEHFAKLGKQLGQTVDSYNKSVGSLERNVMPGIRKFESLGINSDKPITKPEPSEQSPRQAIEDSANSNQPGDPSTPSEQ